MHDDEDDDVLFDRHEEEEPAQFHETRSVRSIKTPNKTGGQVKISNLKREDKAEGDYAGRDAITVIEAELRQFNVAKFDIVKRYVEQIVTGEFFLVKKDIDLSPQPEYIQEAPKLNTHELEQSLIRAQLAWINRINQMFNFLLGILAGASVMHVLILTLSADLFYQLYARNAKKINLLFLILGTFALILGVSISLIYKQKSDEKLRSRQVDRAIIKRHYTMSIVLSVICFINWVILFGMPYFTIHYHYLSQ